MKLKFKPNKKRLALSALGIALVCGMIVVSFLALQRYRTEKSMVTMLQIMTIDLGEENEKLKTELAENLMKLNSLESQDQYKINIDLKNKLSQIETTYKKAVSTYEELLKLKEQAKVNSSFDKAYTEAIVALSREDYDSADKKLDDLSASIVAEKTKIAASFTIPASIPVNNTPPSSGYSRQSVDTEIGQYMVSIISGDVTSTKIIVDTASSATCGNDCPVLSLSDYISRNGAYAGINGSYFCPAEYPSCAGKTNSFDTLLMNKDKTYFNSDNNIYSTVPAVIFGNGYIRFVGQSSEWGRDTSVDSMIANQPMLVRGGSVSFGGDGDPKKGSKSARSFIANKGSVAYIGVVHNATVAEAAIVLKSMGMENALNLDSGGSTALWSGGYKVGPGRNIPNAILFVRK